MKHILPCLVLCLSLLLLSRSESVNHSGIKSDTIPIYDLKGNHVKDTVIFYDPQKPAISKQGTYLTIASDSIDTLHIYDKKGNFIKDSVIHTNEK